MQSRIREKGKALGLMVISFCVLFLLNSQLVTAQQSSSTLAQGFQAENSKDMVAGSLVSMKAGSLQSMDLATAETADRLIGVVDKNPLASISAGEQEVQVALNGTTSVLVSDINGKIRSGDKITAYTVNIVTIDTTNRV